jgi:hypothetical protein
VVIFGFITGQKKKEQGKKSDSSPAKPLSSFVFALLSRIVASRSL